MQDRLIKCQNAQEVLHLIELSYNQGQTINSVHLSTTIQRVVRYNNQGAGGTKINLNTDTRFQWYAVLRDIRLSTLASSHLTCTPLLHSRSATPA